MLTASVSNIDLFRTWREDEDLDMDWLLARLLSKEQTEAMKVGEAFHKTMELATTGDVNSLEAHGYRFEFLKDCEVELAPARELSLTKQYGDLLVRGRVDSITGTMVMDYKSTGQFDPDRLMCGYQWRFYLDMAIADRFRWDVFVIRETDDPKVYSISDFHRLEQTRYPGLADDCAKLAAEYAIFAKQYLPAKQAPLLTPVE